MTVNVGALLSEPPAQRRIGTVSAGAAPVLGLDLQAAADFDDIVEEWGTQSFPASDPPSNW
jgi:hypothetical protein